MSTQKISIGYPLDILFDRENPISGYTKYDQKELHVIFPDDKSKKYGAIIYNEHADDTDNLGRFTGNIVIRGRPGTGKSTLGLQIAVTSVLSYNKKYAAYICLEEEPEKMKLKAESFGWDQFIYPVCHLQNLNHFSSSNDMAEALKRLLTQPNNCPQLIKNRKENKDYRVILPRFSPRSLELSDEQSASLFWERYIQLERLLSAAKTLRKGTERVINHCKTIAKPIPDSLDLRIVVIDSLNTMGNHLLTREELFRIFDLFKRYETIGIFIVEEDEGQVASPDSRLHADIIEYLADMVIALSGNYDNDYFVRYFEIVKSRNQHQVYGKHPCKIGGKHEKNINKNEDRKLFKTEYFSDIGLFPLISLHHTVISTERSGGGKSISYKIKNIGNFNKLLQTELPKNPILTLEGPRGTFKSTLALNILCDGLLQGDTAILIRLRDKPYLQFPLNIPLDQYLLTQQRDYFKNKYPSKKFPDQQIKSKEFWDNFIKIGKMETDLKKYNIIHWKNPLDNNADFIEIDFKSGNLFPEEFIEILRRIYFLLKKNYKPDEKLRCRIVFDDVGLIGVSYPFLRNSKTASDLFLTALVHLMRNYEINLTLVGTTGQYPESDHIVQKAKILADNVITTSYCDVFGDRYVTIMGESQKVGMRKGKEAEYNESVPSIIELGENSFTINTGRLEGLVGFDVGQIHRPGLSLQLFTGGDLHEKYNKEVLRMVRCAFGLKGEKSDEHTLSKEYGDDNVNLVSFNSKDADSIYRSPNILHARPIANTVIRTVDEFLEDDDSLLELKNDHNSKHSRCKSHYKNVLILAYDSSAFSNGNNKKLMNIDKSKYWQVLKDVIDDENKKNAADGEENKENKLLYLGYDQFTSETLNCTLLDLLGKNMFTKSIDNNKINKIINLNFNLNKCNDVFKELCAFQRILNNGWSIIIKDKRIPNDREYLPPGAKVWLCWYSQLREMLDKNKNLNAANICIKPLPNGGFSGDWFIGIVKGSVSYNLGKNIINILTTKEEQYKRFANGVGMPVDKEFYRKSRIMMNQDEIKLDQKKGKIEIIPDYFGWPLGFTHNEYKDVKIHYRTLSALYKIHEKASRRKEYLGYQKYRGVIEKTASQLTECSWEDNMKQKQSIKHIINRLPHQIAMLMVDLKFK